MVDSRLTGELVADLDLSGFSDSRSKGACTFCFVMSLLNPRPPQLYGWGGGRHRCPPVPTPMPYHAYSLTKMLNIPHLI